MVKSFTRKIKPLEILTEEQLKEVHKGILDILENTGVRVEHDRGLKLFSDNGCNVDFEKKRVKIPSYLVETCLRKVPSNFTVRARDSKNDVRIGGNTLYFSTSVGLKTIDLNTWESRRATLKEHNDAMKVVDALDNMHVVLGWELYMDMDQVPSCMAALEGLASAVRNSTKVHTINYLGGKFAIEMAKVVGIDLLACVDASPPLTIYGDPCEALFNFVEAGFPVQTYNAPVMGGTSPATIAGSTMSDIAGIISVVVLVQLIKPGIGVIPSCFAMPMNMKTGSPDFGAVGQALACAMFSQVWRSYRIPVGCATGYESSKKIDFQCGYEKALGTLIGALSGANLLEFQGCVHGELTYHPVQSILDDDIAGWIGHFIEGFDVNDETMALDLIKEVGPIPGYYLNKAHTRKWWKKHYVPKVADRLTYPEWVKSGKKDCIHLAKERMKEILATHKLDPPLTDDQEDAIKSILKKARTYYREKSLISEEEWAAYDKI